MKKWVKWVLLCLVIALLCSCAPVTTVEPPKPEETDKPAESTPNKDDEPTTTTDNLLLNKNAKANEGLLPRGIDDKHTLVKELKDQTLIMYYAAQSDAFSYAAGKKTISETTWFKRLEEKYGIHIRVIRKDARSSLAAQRLALLSGAQLDILSFTPAQLPYTMGMTADATDLMKSLDITNTDFLNQTILNYGANGNRFFTPAGVARNLWYTTGGSSNPRTLSESGLWNLRAFTDFVAERTKTEGDKVKVYGYEARDFADFMTALGTPIIDYDTKFVGGVTAAEDHLRALQQLNAQTGYYYNGQSKSDAPDLAVGTLAMRYGQTPFVEKVQEYPEFDWAPLPTGKDHQNGVVSACAPILALPKDGGQNRAALCAALLWSARFADASHDLLRFTYGMDFSSWTAYYHATNKQLQIVYADEGNPLALRRLVSAPTFEQDDYTALKDNTKLYCINANERLSNDR